MAVCPAYAVTFVSHSGCDCANLKACEAENDVAAADDGGDRMSGGGGGRMRLSPPAIRKRFIEVFDDLDVGTSFWMSWTMSTILHQRFQLSVTVVKKSKAEENSHETDFDEGPVLGPDRVRELNGLI